MKVHSAPTRGRTLDHAAFIYDTCEPTLMLGKQAEYDRRNLYLLDLKARALAEAFRVLRPKGKLVIADMHHLGPKHDCYFTNRYHLPRRQGRRLG